ncbi:hypothetical protein MtrunA17_Chr3g0130021 [Medicago truncatula]|uniref:Uncharacterized protein n=1 Tax=Medicago truncatula TaxID=3880 RepID=A0A396IZ19_MEDTR|nr:hypothetical protein MtrunA17_Chr3g0130021 [Medicago truncatula]
MTANFLLCLIVLPLIYPPLSWLYNVLPFLVLEWVYHLHPIYAKKQKKFQNGGDPKNRLITWILRCRRDHIRKIKIDAFEYVWIFVHNHVETHTRIATNIN